MSLHDALGGMRLVPQWFIWRLDWNAAEGKYDKIPCSQAGTVQRGVDYAMEWMPYPQAATLVGVLNSGVSNGHVRYALGFRLTADCGYWFFDIDKCTAEDGSLLPHAQNFVNQFPGALVEWSSSGKGLHIIGRGTVPPHGCRHKALNLELYTEERGIAFGLNGQASGSADTVHDEAIRALVADYFPYTERAMREAGARLDWRGPADDDELIRRALNARSGAGAAFGGKATFAQLWRGEVEKDSDADAALAAHLAFWTGCDEPRIERLMLRSGLAREKWQERRRDGTYLTYTIASICAKCDTVYKEPERSTAVADALYGLPVPPPGTAITVTQDKPITEEAKARFQVLNDLISACGSVDEMHNEIIPAIAGEPLPAVYIEPLAQAINTKLDYFKAKLPIGQVRKLLRPAIIARVDDVPLWAQTHCYVKDNDKFFDIERGTETSMQGFRAEYARLMPMRENGAREDPVAWALERWGMRTVQSTGYRPDQGHYFEWDGIEYANTYSPISVPATAATISEAAQRAIDALQAHLWDMSGRRQDVYFALLYWLAHNVQKPGVKIRWSPLLKGTQGDGKTLVFNLLRASMGFRNVSVTSNSTLNNSGGFTDWANKAAVNVIEEIWLVGKPRHVLYNAMKEYISNDVANYNVKGGKTITLFNVTNHAATSNHNDAIPLEKNDRRWLVVFTPWNTLDEMMRYCGLTAEGWKARTDAMDHGWRHCAGELRAWFMSLAVPASFDKDGSALLTPERAQMMATGMDDAESVAAQIIEEGGMGISTDVFSSLFLSQQLKIRAQFENFDLPKTVALSHMLTRLGYSKVPKLLKWRGHPHTVWIKNGYPEDLEKIREAMDATVKLLT
jgi:hypothetical protein